MSDLRATLLQMSLDDRIAFLQNNADGVEDTVYTKQLTPEELDLRREELADIAIKIDDLEVQKKEYNDNIKAEMKPLAEQFGQLLTTAKTGYEQVQGVVYHMANHAEGMMETYNHDGELVSSRRLKPSEKSKTIPFNQAGNQ